MPGKTSQEDQTMWTRDLDDSAEQPMTPDQLERWQRRMSPPANEFPAGLGITVLLASTDDVAVGLSQVDAFSTGLARRVLRPRRETQF